ncbi:bifunctional phosphoribosylaminoimidazolecarboxamide formyltransferase/IMP cyclohydrolase PurH [Sphingobacteriales bacterium UPWRP_1]|nr:bifunctional phosphoribosylaminoimidazolecarboxamide formyltransferase/IMP cyclohydrolase [Sphingobacteriales bacterium TSM_CSS]PSJ74775.1 bifunctional phosphoribosylaminoimidazolecarboxamide formyltransferase/IMP cyclohydrolase PurH [Sphingobacteriales bacterium UPWRP_1]
MQLTIRRALISVSDKTHLLPLANTLKYWGCEIISTGGTGKALKEAGISYTDISHVTGNPEAFGGRMKTISFNIESALLYDRDRDADEAAQLGIAPIDMVVCNLYPFQKVLEAGADFDTLIENIDIGGPTMVRAGAKNFKSVAVITDVEDYPDIIAELNENNGRLSYPTRKKLMRKAFNHTADYDALIATAMDKADGQHSLRMAFSGGKTLRYGENSHQQAIFYRNNSAAHSLYDMRVLHGKELSFNNIMDIHAAVETVRALNPKRQGCAIVKHNNPCGLCESSRQTTALELAWEGDAISAFGSIIAFNQPLQRETVSFLQLDNADKSKRKFVEVIIAPQIEPDALQYLQQHKDLRVIELDIAAQPAPKDLRFLGDSLLVQDADQALFSKFETVTTAHSDLTELESLAAFGLKAISNIKSNSIVLVREVKGSFQLLGMGAGQPNRLVSTRLALEKAAENLLRTYTGHVNDANDYVKAAIGESVLVSDAFFPFEDNVELAALHGVKTIIQPGGSIRDKHVITKCNELGIAMVFTGLRHFKH